MHPSFFCGLIEDAVQPDAPRIGFEVHQGQARRRGQLVDEQSLGIEQLVDGVFGTGGQAVSDRLEELVLVLASSGTQKPFQATR